PIGLPRLLKKTILATKSAKGTKKKINCEIVLFFAFLASLGCAVQNKGASFVAKCRFGIF
ncbi:MAG: hypothetical protein KAQ78_05475, partial [Candidatus Latescibacteria bacterium]|nr:hypothetical protein [Candidatus Latescibacterota bacterium]